MFVLDGCRRRMFGHFCIQYPILVAYECAIPVRTVPLGSGPPARGETALKRLAKSLLL